MTANEQRLDAWLDRPEVRIHHRRDSSAGAPDLWRDARTVTMSDTRTLGRLVRWRIPGVAADQTFFELFRDYPFTLLEEGEQYSISGLCGRIWTLDRDYPRLRGPSEFRAWDEPGTVRVLIAAWARERESGGSELVTEARVQPVDRVAALRLRALWAVIGPFERLIAAEPLPVAVRRAETGKGG